MEAFIIETTDAAHLEAYPLNGLEIPSKNRKGWYIKFKYGRNDFETSQFLSLRRIISKTINNQFSLTADYRF